MLCGQKLADPALIRIRLNIVMRLRNLSRRKIPRGLWRSLADGMKVGAILPRAVRDDLGMYPQYKGLRVVVRSEVSHPVGEVVTTGSYTYGLITLHPCKHCTVGFLTQVYIHELVHAWLHQYHDSLYEVRESCGLAEHFADKAYKFLGGKISSRRVCGSYSLDPVRAIKKLPKFLTLAKSLTSSKRKAIEL